MISDLTSAAGFTAPGALTGGPGGKMGKEQFLQLLVAQLNNQDPLNPMQGEDFVAQLAQFSSVEQLISLNEGMEAQTDFQAAMVQAMNGTSALGAIGKTVVAFGNQMQVSATGEAAVRFSLDEAGGNATLRIFDASGAEVGVQELGYLGTGPHTVQVDPSLGLAEGGYTYEVRVQNGDTAAAVTTYSTGVVDGIRYGPNGPVLTSGSMEIPFGQVVEIVR